MIRDAVGDLLSNKMDPRHASALVQLANCSHRINQHADLEARLEELEAANSAAPSLSQDTARAKRIRRTRGTKQGRDAFTFPGIREKGRFVGLKPRGRRSHKKLSSSSYLREQSGNRVGSRELWSG